MAQTKDDLLETAECDDCGDDFEREKAESAISVTHTCGDCQVEQLREHLTTENTLFSRANALDRIQHEVQRAGLPVRDPVDGSLIIDAEVEHGRGIGIEPNGHHIKSITKIVDMPSHDELADACPSCGYDRVDYSFANHYAEYAKTWNCRACGETVKEESSL